jgi:beta-N-acetylhexosaminidase
VRRILTLKSAYGILDWQPVDPEAVTEQINLDASQAALLQAFLDAATVIRDSSNLLPLEPDDNAVIVYYGNAVQIYHTCHALAPEMATFSYTESPLDQEFGQVGRLGIEYDKVVIFVNNASKDPRQRDLVRVLPPEKTVAVLMNSPFDLEQFPDVSSFLALYTDHPLSRTAACQVLFAQHPATGRLPIAVGTFESGLGIDLGSESGDRE